MARHVRVVFGDPAIPLKERKCTMPNLPVPDRFDGILDSTTLAHLATIGPDGYPQVNPIWFLRDEDRILFSVKGDTQKLRNIQRDRHIALSFLDQ